MSIQNITSPEELSIMKLKEELLRNLSNKKKESNKAISNEVPEIFTYFDLPRNEKPWAQPDADLTDYFNYGFTEETFKLYAQKVQKILANKQDTQGKKISNEPNPIKPFEDKLPISKGGLQVIDDPTLNSMVRHLLFSLFIS